MRIGKIAIGLAWIVMFGLPAPSWGKDGVTMFELPMIAPLDCQPTSKQYRLISGNAPGFLYFPGETVELTFTFAREANASDNYALEIQGVHTRRPNKAKTYIDPFGFPDILNLDGAAVRHPFTVVFGDQKEATFELKGVPVPERFGTYCLILLRGEGRKKEDRILLGSVARLLKTRADAVVENTPVFGEGQIFAGFKQKAEAAKAYHRMGVRGVRCEISWRGPREDGSYDWSELDKLAGDLKAGGIQAMFTLGGVTSKRYGIATNQHPTPAAVDPNWKGSYYGGQADWGCAPRYFEEYGQWIKAFAERYWEGGKGALWGFENFNEPWEGGGISGYARDCLSYRDWQRHLARAAHAVSKDIRICAASSIMNTEDKLYSEGPRADGTYEFDEFLDVFTDHYVPPNNAYGPLVAKRHGKFSMENETWLVISEYLLPQVMCQWMAAGQQAVSPWHPQVLFQRGAGAPQQYQCPSTVPVATAAFNYFVTGLRFEKIVFREHLPWLFQFGQDRDPQGVCVLFGQLLTRGGPTPQDQPEGRPWAQVDAVDGGTITIDNRRGLFKRAGAMQFYDVAGNEIHRGEKWVTLELGILPTYIRAQEGPAFVAERIRTAMIKGKYPAEIRPRDFTRRLADQALVLDVELTNRLNRPIAGTLDVKAPEGFVVANNGAGIALAAGETKTVVVQFAKVAADAANQYPFEFAFDTDAGRCTYRERLNCCIAVKGMRKIDGDLSDWADVPGITLVGKDKKISEDELARKPWLRLLEDLPQGTLIAELKLAWDNEFLYVAARVNDATPQMDKLRMAGRDENAYFHSAASDREEPWQSWLAKYAPGQSFAQVPYVYKKKPDNNSYTGDQLQLAFNVTDDWHDLAPTTDRVPYGFHAVPDTDYEYCAYLCADGQSELWNLLGPGIPRIHDWPHQPRGKLSTNPTSGARHVVRQDGNVRIYELAIPQAAIKDLVLREGNTFKFSFLVGNNKGANILYGEKKAVTKSNGLTLHPYWALSPSCEIVWRLVGN